MDQKKHEADYIRPREQCLKAISAFTFFAVKSLMLREESEYALQIQNLAQACAEAINQHHILARQVLSLIEGRIAGSQGQQIQAANAKIQQLQIQRRDFDSTMFFNPGAEAALDRRIDSLHDYMNTSIGEIQKTVITDSFVRAHRGYQANISPHLIYNYEPPPNKQSNIGMEQRGL